MESHRRHPMIPGVFLKMNYCILLIIILIVTLLLYIYAV